MSVKAKYPASADCNTPLKVITFGSETMPQFLLNRLQTIFKDIKLIQKYGTTEFSSPISKTKSEDASWIKIDPNKCQTKIVDNILFIKTDTTMVGYLNSKNIIDKNGWYNTGDEVVQNGEYIKILGRKSESINVGGEKVFPQEIEDIIINHPKVKEVLVYGEKNPIVGNIVCAKVVLTESNNNNELIKDIKSYCNKSMSKFKVPVKIKVIDDSLINSRFTKQRSI